MVLFVFDLVFSDFVFVLFLTLFTALFILFLIVLKVGISGIAGISIFGTGTSPPVKNAKMK